MSYSFNPQYLVIEMRPLGLIFCLLFQLERLMFFIIRCVYKLINKHANRLGRLPRHVRNPATLKIYYYQTNRKCMLLAWLRNEVRYFLNKLAGISLRRNSQHLNRLDSYQYIGYVKYGNKMVWSLRIYNPTDEIGLRVITSEVCPSPPMDYEIVNDVYEGSRIVGMIKKVFRWFFTRRGTNIVIFTSLFQSRNEIKPSIIMAGEHILNLSMSQAPTRTCAAHQSHEITVLNIVSFIEVTTREALNKFKSTINLEDIESALPTILWEALGVRMAWLFGNLKGVNEFLQEMILGRTGSFHLFIYPILAMVYYWYCIKLKINFFDLDKINISDVPILILYISGIFTIFYLLLYMFYIGGPWSYHKIQRLFSVDYHPEMTTTIFDGQASLELISLFNDNNQTGIRANIAINNSINPDKALINFKNAKWALYIVLPIIVSMICDLLARLN